MQQCLAVRRQFDQHFAMVVFGMLAADSTALGQTVHKFPRAVVAQAKPIGESGDSGASPPGEALQREKQLVLLGFDSFGASCQLAGVQELPDAVAKLGKALKAEFRNIRHWPFGLMVTLVPIHRR